MKNLLDAVLSRSPELSGGTSQGFFATLRMTRGEGLRMIGSEGLRMAGRNA